MKRMHLIAPIALTGALCAGPAAAQDYANLATSLFGENITGSGGDDGASGDFNGEIDYQRGRLCYYLEIEDLDDASGVAIHQGAAEADGAETLALTLSDDGGDEVCVDGDPALLRTIGEKPEDYYLIVRSGGHPEGALRGQLHN
jgi:hypothetical protein